MREVCITKLLVFHAYFKHERGNEDDRIIVALVS